MPALRFYSRKLTFFAVTALILGVFAFVPVSAHAATVREITFPVAEESIDHLHWSNTYGATRSGGRLHKGVDLMGDKMTPLVAAKDSVVVWGYYRNGNGNYLTLQDADGWEYMYVHVNNDTPGTDDGSAACKHVYSAKICATVQSNGKLAKGTVVKEGEIIGYMGDSGNAERTSPHLHFEIHTPSGQVIDPTASVNAAKKSISSTPSAPTVELNVAEAEASIDRLYKAFFHRKPDVSGKKYWLEKRKEGHSLEDIAEWFAMSSEYQSRYKGKNFEEFIDILYKNVLKRPSDENGKKYWIERLRTKKVTRGTIVVYFSESEEMKLLYP